MLDLLHLIVGLEDDADGSLRVYLDMRMTGVHTHVADEKAKAELRSAWAGSSMSHLTTRVRDDALCTCPTTPDVGAGSSVGAS